MDTFKKLGSEKQKDFNTNFDVLYDKYKKKAVSEGHEGELKFVKEHGRVLIYVGL